MSVEGLGRLRGGERERGRERETDSNRQREARAGGHMLGMHGLRLVRTGETYFEILKT